jgi:hypothetical protein
LKHTGDSRMRVVIWCTSVTVCFNMV